MKFSSKYFSFFLLTLLCLSFIVFKLPYLGLPYFWDESWVYSRAIHAMVDSGPSLMPGSIDADLYTGHPLMFYFLSSFWMSVFGTDLTTAHIFPMLLTCLLFIVLYFLYIQISREYTVAFFVSALVALQPITMSQSGMLLAEILLSFFTFSAVLFYLRKQYFWMLFFLSCLVLTKEAGLVMTVVLSSFVLYDSYQLEKKLNRKFLYSLLMLSVPFLVGASFYVIQYMKLGWFFFPRHTGWVDFSLEATLGKLRSVSEFVFINQGRYIISVSVIGLFVYSLFKKKQLSIQSRKVLVLLWVFIAIYFLFCIVNFLSPRYLYCTIPALFLVFAILIEQVNLSKKTQYLILSVCIMWFCGRVIMSYKAGLGDTEMSYTSLVKVHQKMTHYVEEKNLYDVHIATHFLMIEQLKHTTCGYLRGKPFNHVDASMEADTKYLILSNVEQDFNLEELRKTFDINLEKKFEDGPAWCEIYVVKARLN